MNNVVVVGVGNIGMRHLQGLTKCAVPVSLYGVDPLSQSITAARQALADIPHDIEFLSSLEDLPTTIDLAIIATNSEVRLAVLEQLVSHASIHYLLLEKVLFQSAKDFARCRELLKEEKAEAYVNCPRRLYDLYQSIAAWIGDAEVDLLTVTGGRWGLACNGIHFVDLFGYLTGRQPDAYSVVLDSEIQSSKRSGFIEFTGSIHASACSSKLIMTATDSDNPKVDISLYAGSKSCFVDEVAGVAHLFDDREPSGDISFPVPYQSELTSGVADGLLRGEGCSLTDFDTSVALHLPFIEALLDHCRRQGNTDMNRLPIT